MRPVLIRSLAVIALGGLVLAGVLWVASTVDARPPLVVEIRLTQAQADDAHRALITTSVEVVFSEPVDQGAAASAIHLEPSVAGAVSWSGSTMIFTPADPLELETAYTVTVAGAVRDLAGNVMDQPPAPFAFETTGRPSLVEALPADGATDVPLEDPIGLTFSTLMDTASVEAELRVLPAFPHELRWSGQLLEIVPTAPLRPGARYRITIQGGATDIAGVALDAEITVSFRTVETGLTVDTLMPGDGIDGIAPSTPIAVIFDRPIDPGSVTGDSIEVTPALAGTTNVVADAAGAERILVFTPSGQLPPNTTFDVQLAGTVTSTDGGALAAARHWTFTTGAPVVAISNQITFLSDRAGVANVWSMNPDGSGKRQLSAELAPVVDYAIAPDGSSLVLADGRRLVFQRADGSDRRVLTADSDVEFDPAYSPAGDRIAFARADAGTGEGLGLWEWPIEGGDPRPIEMPAAAGDGPSPSASDGAEAQALRAPRYAPDGGALAFVDAGGSIGVLELASSALTRVPFAAAAAPTWLPDSSGIVLTGRRGQSATSGPFAIPIEPITATAGDSAFVLGRSAGVPTPLPYGPGAHPLAISSAGAIAYVDAHGDLWLTEVIGDAGSILVTSVATASAAFAPGEPAIVIGAEGSDGIGPILRVETRGGRPTVLTPDGANPRWLP